MERLKEVLPSEAGLEGVKELQIHDIDEGKEPKIFFEGLLDFCIVCKITIDLFKNTYLFLFH